MRTTDLRRSVEDVKWRRSLFLALAGLLAVSASATGVPTSDTVRFGAAGDFAMNPGTTGAVLDSIAEADLDAFFVTGDLSYADPGSEQAWCDFVTERVGAGFPFELLAGNHESNGQDGNINDFSACLPNQLPGAVGTYGRQYYVDVPQTDPLLRFVMISPDLPFPDGTWSYAAGTPRYAWTAAAIDGARVEGIPWVVVGMHKVCLSVGNYDCEVGTDLTNMLLAKKVDLVVSGHEHNYQRTKQLTLGPGCAGLAIGGYDPDCVADADDDLRKGAGTVFATIGTAGVEQRPIYPSDPEAPYFAAMAGSNQDLTYGFGQFDVSPTRLAMSFVPAAVGTYTDDFTITFDENPPDNLPPTASFSSATDGLTASFDASGSADSDGVVIGYSWDFGDGGSGTGVLAQHSYAQPGIYQVTLEVTDDDGATHSLTRPVAVTEAPPEEVVAADAWERTLAEGWGSADVGGPWSVNSAASSVSDGVGRITMRTAGTGPLAYLNSAAARDLDVRYRLALDKVPVGTGSRVDHSLLLRRGDGDYYRGMVRVQENGSVRASLTRVVDGGATTLGADITVPGLTYAAGDVLLVRAQAVGSGTSTLRLKVWKAGQDEPEEWTIVRTDTTSVLQDAGSFGYQVYLSGRATNAPVQARFDDLRMVLAD